ncbi:hypothetical protein RND81_08G122000 [Saponaria officinalis]|uniref:Ycf49-like protein n=1 Tax=Saponaria officinalis TaxID=3572 RepID=A0AAW1J6S9_SAPOF
MMASLLKPSQITLTCTPPSTGRRYICPPNSPTLSISCSLKPWFSSTTNKTIKCAPSTPTTTTAMSLLLLTTGVSLSLVGPALAEQSPLFLELTEPSNALSLPTWAVHVSSVVEWIIAMALVWQYGERPGNESWKGLSWGMVPLLGGAMCACTWHFFYNSETLEALVALQAALTFFGNATMCIAAFRIYKSQNQSKNI